MTASSCAILGSGMSQPQPPNQMAASLPVINAILVCDRAEREPETGKMTLYGIFENISAKSFPALHPQCAVYVKMTETSGNYHFRLDLVHLDTADLVARAELSLALSNRLGSTELHFDLRNVVFPEPGLYEFQLFDNGRFLGNKTVRLLLI